VRDLFLSYEDVVAIEVLPPALLAALLAEHRPALDAVGLHPAELAGSDQLWTHRAHLPIEVVNTLHQVQGLADEAGVEQILNAAGGPLFVGAPDLVPLLFAARTRVEHPEVFDRAVGRQFTEPLFRFREFVGRDRVTPPREPDLLLAAGRIGAQFGRRGRGQECRIRDWTERDGNRYFSIEHSGLPRIERGLVDGVVRAVPFVPVVHDLVVHDLRLGRLRVSAADADVADGYMRTFGELLFADDEWFHGSVVVSLDPLRTYGAEVLSPTAGVVEARVVRLEVASRTTGSGVVVSRGANVLRMLAEQLIDSHQHGPARAATFRLRLLAETRLREVSIEVPDLITWDWRRDNAVIRGFLEERGFLSGLDGGASCQVA
jgi:hypothetical protein